MQRNRIQLISPIVIIPAMAGLEAHRGVCVLVQHSLDLFFRMNLNDIRTNSINISNNPTSTALTSSEYMLADPSMI